MIENVIVRICLYERKNSENNRVEELVARKILVVNGFFAVFFENYLAAQAINFSCEVASWD